MYKHFTITLLIIFSLAVVVSHWYISQQLVVESQQTSLTNLARQIPDFVGTTQVKARKKLFFNYFKPLVSGQNRIIQALREDVEKGTFDDQALQALAKTYRIKSNDSTVIRQQLLEKLDSLPPSLVMAQAAIESAWGTSRFAVEGNNYFGQWCFKEGCGLVPEARVAGKHHEVRQFDSPVTSVASYMRNLNSHPAYKKLRATRAQLRASQQPLSGCLLAETLNSYSEQGHAYGAMIKQLIRANKLEADPKGYCRRATKTQQKKKQSSTEPTKSDTMKSIGHQ